eukprot:gene5142-5791_t
MGTERNFLLITANIGSLFEGPSIEKLQSAWFKEVLQIVKENNPAFLAIHCQEVGGKKSDKNKNLVHKFVGDIFKKEELKDYTTCLAYLDEDYKAQDQYTALGSFYFIKKDLKAEQWNFQENSFGVVSQQREIFIATYSSAMVQKRKYPLNYFPEGRWSRKGYMLSKWRIGGRILNLVNIHLMNDVCNIKALQTSPYIQYRKDTLKYTLDNLNDNETDYLVLFGDFNIRLDAKGFVENHLNSGSPLHVPGDGDTAHSVVYKSLDDKEKELLRISARKFTLHNWEYFTAKNITKLRSLDRELDWCSPQLKELPITFLPSYPHSEDPQTDAAYSDTRCPAWCDRILFNGKTHTELEKRHATAKYDCVGANVCIGDHKPVFLSFALADLPRIQASENNI